MNKTQVIFQNSFTVYEWKPNADDYLALCVCVYMSERKRERESTCLLLPGQWLMYHWWKHKLETLSRNNILKILDSPNFHVWGGPDQTKVYVNIDYEYKSIPSIPSKEHIGYTESIDWDVGMRISSLETTQVVILVAQILGAPMYVHYSFSLDLHPLTPL